MNNLIGSDKYFEIITDIIKDKLPNVIDKIQFNNQEQNNIQIETNNSIQLVKNV